MCGTYCGPRVRAPDDLGRGWDLSGLFAREYRLHNGSGLSVCLGAKRGQCVEFHVCVAHPVCVTRLASPPSLSAVADTRRGRTNRRAVWLFRYRCDLERGVNVRRLAALRSVGAGVESGSRLRGRVQASIMSFR